MSARNDKAFEWAAIIFGALAALFGIVLIGGGIWGYVANIVQIVKATSIDPMLLLRVVGVVLAPLGAVLGWM
jgi:hypothetical protein